MSDSEYEKAVSVLLRNKNKTQVKELANVLDALSDKLKEDLVTCSLDDVKELQGGIFILRKVSRDISEEKVDNGSDAQGVRYFT